MAKNYKMTALTVTRNDDVFTMSWKWGPDGNTTKKPKLEYKIVTNQELNCLSVHTLNHPSRAHHIYIVFFH